MNPLVLAGAVAGAQFLIESNGGWLSLVGAVKSGTAAGASSTPLNSASSRVSQPGNTAAVNFLVGLGSIAGLPVTVSTTDPNGASMSGIWAQIQPSVTSSTDGSQLAHAFLGAYDAARKADPVNYNPLAAVQSGLGLDALSWLGISVFTPCSQLTSDQLNSLGQAGCALSSAKDAYGSGNGILAQFGFNANGVGTIDNSQIVDAIATLTSEMDARGFTEQGLSPTDNPCASPPCWTFDNITGGIQYAIAQSTQTVLNGATSAVGSVLGAAGSALLSSNLVWAAAFGLIAWKVLA